MGDFDIFWLSLVRLEWREPISSADRSAKEAANYYYYHYYHRRRHHHPIPKGPLPRLLETCNSSDDGTDDSLLVKFELSRMALI
jgi:hypothetical protein